MKNGLKRVLREILPPNMYRLISSVYAGNHWYSNKRAAESRKKFTTYYVSVNGLVIQPCSEEIKKVKSTKFIPFGCRRLFDNGGDFIYINDPSSGGILKFSKNPTRIVYIDSTVTYVALQLAFYFGFDKVILIGVDHYFSTKGECDREIVSQGDDPNHFDPSYFGKGFRWQLPNLPRSEEAYRLAKLEFEKNGGEILDATVEGRLNVFRKISYNSLFQKENN
jgi:hypothetical protein